MNIFVHKSIYNDRSIGYITEKSILHVKSLNKHYVFPLFNDNDYNYYYYCNNNKTEQ